MPALPAARLLQRHKAAPRAASRSGVALQGTRTSHVMDMMSSLGSVSVAPFNRDRQDEAPSSPVSGLPARLLDTGNQTGAGQVAEADAADAELAIHSACPATQFAAALHPNPFARRHLDRVGSPPAGLQLRHLPPE